MTTKTAVVYDQTGEEPLSFFVVEEDWRQFEGVLINNWTEDPEVEALQEDLCRRLYDEIDGTSLYKEDREAFLQAIKDGHPMVVCGFYP